MPKGFVPCQGDNGVKRPERRLDRGCHRSHRPTPLRLGAAGGVAVPIIEPAGVGSVRRERGGQQQDDNQQWLDTLPEGLADIPTADALRTVCELDVSALEVDLPRGFGRD
jgi:hypothetical protein